ncbi:hypothetical protein HAX54_042812 [Datura stramonium]|uniref:Protein NRT1/ PTR FAMILY 1.2-like n=1 Tax=Datura stramonium TaxID=4076 RepID=A0ABS8SMP8_DATST|nr:hypothetical protein [Datura stramonium]
MGKYSEQEEHLLKHSHNSRKGGLKTMPFIIVNESFERLASFGLQPNMIIYITTFYHMEAAAASSLLGIWSALSNGLAIVGAFVSDSYLGRFRAVAIGSISSLIGISILWLTTIIPQFRPSPCNNQQHGCNGTTTAQFALILCSFGLISIGAGFVRPCSVALGADQLDNKTNPDNERVIDSYFNWFYASLGASTFLALTVIVYIQDNFGWKVGFGVPAILMVLSVSMFLMGSPLYVKVKARGSLFVGLFQVAVAAFRKRHIDIQMINYNDECYYKAPESKCLVPSSDFRCMNRACIIQDPDKELKPDGTTSNPWSLCCVEQVESLKSFLRVLPMWSTSFMPIVSMSIPLSIFQLKTVDRHVFPGHQFEIPAGSFTFFSVFTLTIWNVFYDRALVPLLMSRYPRGLSPVFRMGVGLIISCAAMALAAITENIRRNKAINEGFKDDPNAVLNMSALWFVPQFALLGLAEALNVVGLMEFIYTEFPKSMSSFALAICTIGIAVANSVCSLLVSVVDGVTSAGGNTIWLSTNINKAHLDYFYYLIAFLSVNNFLYFLFVCRFCNHYHDGLNSRLSFEEENEHF